MRAQLHSDVFGAEWRMWEHALPLWRMAMDRAQPHDALTIGDEQGSLALWLALQGMNVRCTTGNMPTSDMVPMKLHVEYGVLDKVSYARGYPAVAGTGAYDLVLSGPAVVGTKELVHAVDARLKPGGVWLFGMERGRMDRVLRELSSVKGYEVEVRYWGFLGRSARTDRQRDIFARIDPRIMRFVPDRWRCLAFGTATKSC